MVLVYYEIDHRLSSVEMLEVASVKDLKSKFFGDSLTLVDMAKIKISLDDNVVRDDDADIPVTYSENRLLILDVRGNTESHSVDSSIMDDFTTALKCREVT